MLAGVAFVRGDRVDRLEVGLAALALALTAGLSLWRFDENLLDTADLPAGALGARRALGRRLPRGGERVRRARRDARLRRLTWLATAALVVFVDGAGVRGVRRPSSPGAALFLIVGVGAARHRASWPTAAADGSSSEAKEALA